jgi:dephospho-CoA kinase
MIIVGLTGSIGMGKSAVAAMFRGEGIPVFDADAEVHRLQAAGGRLVGAIEAAFPGTTGPQGVDRQKLGAAVLSDPAALKRLEAIVHPAVGEERAAFLADNAEADIVVFDIPLLFEKGRPPGLDTVIVVSAPPEVQRARVLARPGMTPAKFESILALQMPDAEKRALADIIVDTGTSLAETRAHIRKIVACLRARKGPSLPDNA